MSSVSNARRSDPPTVDRFHVHVTELGEFGVASVTGLEATAERRQVRLATLVPDFLARWVGDATVPRWAGVSPPLVLTRAVGDGLLRGWFDDRLAEVVEPQGISITLVGTDGAPVERWRCENAVPTRWVGPVLRADRRAVATESLELVHDGVERIDG